MKERGNTDKTEVFFNSLIANGHDAISLTDENFKVVYRSPFADRITGWTAEERLKEGGIELTHPDDIEKLKIVIKEVLAHPHIPIPVSFRTIHKAGHYIWMEGVMTNMLRDENVKGIVCNLRDITLQKRSEEELQKIINEISDYKYALDESSILAITDQKGIIKHANNNFCRISKYSREELIGQDHRIINSGYHPKEFIRNLWVTIANGKIWKGELKNKAKDGITYWVDTTIVPFLNEQGKPYQYISIRSDITERKRVEELIIANEELVSQNAEREKRAAELIIANRQLAFEGEEKAKRAAELIIANRELTSQNAEKAKRAAELIIANKELLFQTEQKAKRAEELMIANKDLAFQSKEKEKRAAELLVANKELLFQNDEKEKRAAELSEMLERVSFLASIADNIQDPVISTTNFDGNNLIITRWNKPAEKLFEWKSDEVIGKNAAEIFKTGYPYETRDQIFESWKTNGFWQGELIYHAKSGKPLQVLSTLSYLKNADGIITGNLVLIRDITERKKAEDALYKLNEELEQRVEERTVELDKSEKQFRALVENSDDIIAMLDENMYPFYRSPSAERLTGYTSEDRKGGVKIEQIHPDDAEKITDCLAKIKTNPGKVFPITYRLKHKEGHWIWLEGTFVNLIDDRAVRGIIANMRDITKRKKTEEEIIALNEGLEIRVKERTEELESFSNSVAHDLRAPLRAMKGYSAMLEEDHSSSFSPEAKRLVAEVKANADRMTNLIDDLLAFSRLGRKEVNKSLIDMNQLTGRAIAEINKTVAHHAKIEFPELLPVSGDYALLEQVMINLLSNAIKYSSKKETPVIEVKSRKERSELIYSIKDNGAGFDMDYANKLFVVFQRLHSMEEFKGTGVGLAIVRRIINKHDGKVWAEGEVDRGATFFFSLPADQVMGKT